MKDLIVEDYLRLYDDDGITITNIPAIFRYYGSFLNIPTYMCDEIFIHDRSCLSLITRSIRGISEPTIIVIPSRYISKFHNYDESLSSVILHEIGHYKLRHLSFRWKLLSKFQREVEADMFSINFGGRFYDFKVRYNIKYRIVFNYFEEYYGGYITYKEIPMVINYIIYMLFGLSISHNTIRRMEEVHLRIERCKQQS